MNIAFRVSSIALVSLLLSACGGDDDHKMNNSSSSTSSATSSLASSSLASSLATSSSSSSAASSSSQAAMVKFSVVITNLTAGQPLSPSAVVLHKPGFKGFTVGMPASVELERIAEAGNADSFISDATNNTATYAAVKAPAGIPPGGTVTVMLEAPIANADQTSLQLTLLSMLGNTNDGFTGLNAVNLSALKAGESTTFDTISYDAGTENNTESAATVPGPAAGGEGFNAARDDSLNMVSMHSGVLTKDDGNPDSALTSANRWDNPVARITITRLAQ